MPATAVGTARMAAQAASLRVTSVCRACPMSWLSLEREGQNLPERIDFLLHAADVVGHVAEQSPHGRIDRDHLGVLQLAADFDERSHGVAQPQEIAPKQIEAFDLRL